MEGRKNKNTLFDFSKPSSVKGWQSINDAVMGGLSQGKVSWDPAGVMVFSGNVSLENNGGFASIRSPVGPYDLSNTAALILRFRGDGKIYKFSMRTDPFFDGISYQVSFETLSGEWQDVRFSYDKFLPTYHGNVLSGEPPPDISQISNFGLLIANKQQGRFRLEVASIKTVE